MSTNNFFRTFNSITPYPPGDAVNRFSYLTKNSYRGCGTSGGQYTAKFTSAEQACSSSNNNSCSTEFYISFPSGSLQSGSSKVYSDAEGTTLAYPNGGDGYFHISASYDNGYIDGKSPIGVNGGFSCKIETGSIITELISCDLYFYNTASLSKRVATSLSSGAYLNAGYYKVSGSALNLYYIQVGSGGEVSSTGTCGTPP